MFAVPMVEEPTMLKIGAGDDQVPTALNRPPRMMTFLAVVNCTPSEPMPQVAPVQSISVNTPSRMLSESVASDSASAAARAACIAALSSVVPSPTPP